MTTGQTILAMGALVLLTTIMLNFYRIFSHSWDTVDGTQMGIDATTIATSIFEMAHGLAFDAATDTMTVSVDNKDQWLTAPASLGPETFPIIEDTLTKFNDFDDFNLYSSNYNNPPLRIDAGANGIYKADFHVYYVQPDDVNVQVWERTFTKRMDIEVWRSEPPPPAGADIDTVRMFTVMGYFTFQ